MSTTSFLVPSFSKSEKGKVNNAIDVPSEHVLVRSTTGGYVPAISSEGFPANRDGIYVFSIHILKKLKRTKVGFSSTMSFDARSESACPGFRGVNGVCLSLFGGTLWGGTGENSEEWNKRYIPPKITNIAKEVIAIMKISKNGSNRKIWFVVDGNEGRSHELANSDFENENGSELIFPVVALSEKQQIKFVSFNQVKSRSPKIDKLMKEFLKSENNNNQKTPKKIVASKTKISKKIAIKKTTKTVRKNKSSAKKKTAKKTTKKAGKKIAKK